MKQRITGAAALSLRQVRSRCGASLNLYNLTITKGYSGFDGGAIYNEGSLAVETSKFLANETGAAASGGAIYSEGFLSIVASEFAENRAGNGGALYVKWAAATADISASNFHHNETRNATDGWGGTILLFDGAKVHIRGTTINDNKAIEGGAI
jgi:hypothetical protein